MDAIAAEAAALAKGLRSVLTGTVVDILSRCFTHPVLNAMLAGLADVALEDWQAHTKYKGSIELASQVAWLWEVISSLDQPGIRALLAFVTGTSALPAGGFAGLRGFNNAAHPFTGECLTANCAVRSLGYFFWRVEGGKRERIRKNS